MGAPAALLLSEAGGLSTASVTVGFFAGGATFYGYSGPANDNVGSYTGSLAFPKRPAAYCYEVGSVPGSYDLIVIASQTGFPVAFFTTIKIQDDTGTIRTYTAAAASSPGNGLFTWGTGSSLVWSNTTTNPRSVQIL